MRFALMHPAPQSRRGGMHCFGLCAAPKICSRARRGCRGLENRPRRRRLRHSERSPAGPLGLAAIVLPISLRCMSSFTEMSRTGAAQLPFMLQFEMLLPTAFSLAALRAAISSVPFARSISPAAIHARMRLSALWNAIEAYAARQPERSLKQPHAMLSRTSFCPIL